MRSTVSSRAKRRDKASTSFGAFVPAGSGQSHHVNARGSGGPANRGRQPELPANDLESLKGLGLVTKALNNPVPNLPPQREVNIGVSFRNDSKGTAHTGHDLKAISSLANVKGLGTPQGVTLPRGANGPNVPQRDFDESTLKNIDMLYIPGGPYRNNTQTARESGNAADRDLNKPIKDFQQDEHRGRTAYEVDMIQKAKELGIPVMAVCAGTWRLVEAYGGEVETLPKEERARHKAEDTRQTWDLKHDVRTQRGTLLDSMSRGKEDSASHRGKKRAFTIQGVNSTHWATVKTTGDSEQSKLSQAPRQSLDPNDSLEISAWSKFKDKSVRTTVEGVSSKHGVPVVGMQWHPESYLPGMLGEDKGFGKKGQQRTENANRVFKGMVQAAETHRNKQSLMQEIKARVPKRK
jgi:putative glutamine amidotransferase